MITGVDIDAFCYPTEDLEKVKRAFMTVSPVEPSITSVSTHFGAEIKVLSARLSNKKEINEFISRLKSLPRDQLDLLKSQARARIDEKGHFYIRFDKFRAVDGELYILDTGESIRVNIKFTSFPMSMEKVLSEVVDLL